MTSAQHRSPLPALAATVLLLRTVAQSLHGQSVRGE